MHKPAPVLENDTHKILWDFDIHTDHLISARRPELIIIIIIINKEKKKKIENLQNCRFSVPADHRIKLKECEKKDKYLDLARESKKLWNMKMSIVPIVIGAFGTVTEGLWKGLEDLEAGGRVEIIQMIPLLKTARILRRVHETWGDLLSLKLQVKPSANADVKNSKRVYNKNNKNNGTIYHARSSLGLNALVLRKRVKRQKYFEIDFVIRWNLKKKINIIWGHIFNGL